MKRMKLFILLVAMSVIAAPLPALAQATAPAEPQVLEVLNPFGERAEAPAVPAPRLDTLEGKTIGLINTDKPNSNYFLNAVEELLKDRYPGIQFKYFLKWKDASVLGLYGAYFAWSKHPDAIPVAPQYNRPSDLTKIQEAGVDAVINALSA